MQALQHLHPIGHGKALGSALNERCLPAVGGCSTKLASRALLRRAFIHFAANVDARAFRGMQAAAAQRLHNARTARRCLRSWRMALSRARVLRAMHARRLDRLRLTALHKLQLHCQQCRCAAAAARLAWAPCLYPFALFSSTRHSLHIPHPCKDEQDLCASNMECMAAAWCS